MIETIFKYKRVFLTIFTTLMILGLISWLTMPREEDPRLKKRFSNIQVIYPGATAEEVYRLIIKPLEDELVRVAQLKSFESTARSEFAFIDLRLKSSVSELNEINEAWDEVEDAIDEAYTKFPLGSRRPKLDKNSLDQDAIVLSITGGDGIKVQMQALRELEDRLLLTPLVATVNRFADPGEAIRINIKEDRLNELGLDILQLNQKLQLSNNSISSGSIKYSEKKLTVKTNSSFKSIDDLRNYTFDIQNGQNIKLSDVATVSKGINLPRERFFRFNGEDGLSLSVVPQEEINLIQFGANVRKVLEDYKSKNKQVSIDIVSFQPDNVSARIKDLSNSLLLGIAIIGIALFITMGLKISLLSIFLVPSITLAALSFYNFTGGVLHQISIAAFVVALGLLVDNVIVVLESIQEYLDRGMSNVEAARKSVKSLALPLTSATGTTVASFIPMLGSSGTTADFTRAIPTVVVICLITSFLIALLVTPILGMFFLKNGDVKSWSTLTQKFELLGRFSVKRPKLIIILTILSIIGSGAFFPKIKKKFFNDADRVQLVVELKVAEGSHYSLVDSLAQKAEQYLKSRSEVNSVASYIGRGTPQFFYNLSRVPRSSHVAQLIVICKDPSSAQKIKGIIQKDLDKLIPEAFVVVRSLAQGPPTKAPIEYRISENNISKLNATTEELIKIIRSVNGTTKIRSTNGIGTPVLYFDINDANASKYNLERSLVGAKIFARTRGIEVGSYRYDDEVYPIILGNEKNEDFSIDDLSQLKVAQTITKPVSLSNLSVAELRWEPAIFNSYNGKLISSVYAELRGDFGFANIVAQINEKVKQHPELKDMNIALGGEAAESEEANTAILKVIPLGVLLLLISLLIQFNSYKKVLIIMGATFPMFIGIMPGLLLANQPFGFFTLLALLSLIGIVVNNGILLVDQIDVNQASGMGLNDSITKGVARRVRPIFLTTLTTVLGLLPLTMTASTLWPPFAWAMIFGLLASMFFTPVFVPALYKVFMESKELGLSKKIQKLVRASLIFFLIFGAGDFAKAESEIGLLEVIEKTQGHPLLKSQDYLVREREAEKTRLEAQRYLPSVELNTQRLNFNVNREFTTPIGNFGGVGTDQTTEAINVKQSLYNPSNYHGSVDAIRLEKESLQASKERLKFMLLRGAIKTYANQLKLKLSLSSLQELIKKLKKQSNEIKRLLSLGRVSEVDLFKVQLALSDAETKEFSLQKQYQSSFGLLAQAVGQEEELIALKVENIEKLVALLSAEKMIKKDRKDIEAIDLKLKSLQYTSKSITYSRLPEISLIGSYQREDPSVFAPNSFTAIGIQVSLPIFSSNKRTYEKRKVANLKSSLEFQKRDLVNKVHFESNFLQSILEGLANEWPRKKSDLKRAREVVRLEERRYYQGKSSLNDLLEAEILLQQKTEEVLTHPYEYLSRWADFQASQDFPDLTRMIGEGP